MKLQVDCNVPCEVRDTALALLDVRNAYTDAILEEEVLISETSKECYFEWAEQSRSSCKDEAFISGHARGTLHHDFTPHGRAVNLIPHNTVSKSINLSQGTRQIFCYFLILPKFIDDANLERLRYAGASFEKL